MEEKAIPYPNLSLAFFLIFQIGLLLLYLIFLFDYSYWIIHLPNCTFFPYLLLYIVAYIYLLVNTFWKIIVYLIMLRGAFTQAKLVIVLPSSNCPFCSLVPTLYSQDSLLLLLHITSAWYYMTFNLD